MSFGADPYASGRDSVDLSGDAEVAEVEPLLLAALTSPDVEGRSRSGASVPNVRAWMRGTEGTSQVSAHFYKASVRWLSCVNCGISGAFDRSTAPETVIVRP